ncbi:enoyl-CoA hydratase-related protein [Algiphilus sp. W345]|uniref:Enoyl-CoA hydratase-related protein n=1 Tax=Banduia mediterranea TaxID=3075609 RepID=A0ABU2WFJ4_9GAMM|nr:enoyl-CoA hydratase-related protein [Algiphilus sp. W345]MDT0496379.1 enoyl-CoA hydratase-related protein [Algiphilus sp. W345]
MNPPLLFVVADGVGEIVLNRPEAGNAFTVAMLDAWVQALERCIAEDAVRAVLLRGNGRHFCAGGDLQDMKRELDGAPSIHKDKLWSGVHRIPRLMQRLDKPVVAAMQGAATGAGLDMALQCDLRIGAEDARVAASYIRIGLVPGDGGAWLLPRLIGLPRALEMLLTGDFVDAQRALAMGLFNRIVPAAALEDEARALARRLAAGPATAMRLTKRAAYQGQGMDFLSHLDQISSHFVLAAKSPEHREGITAILEKRSPRFVP